MKISILLTLSFISHTSIFCQENLNLNGVNHGAFEQIKFDSIIQNYLKKSTLNVPVANKDFRQVVDMKTRGLQMFDKAFNIDKYNITIPLFKILRYSKSNYNGYLADSSLVIVFEIPSSVKRLYDNTSYKNDLSIYLEEGIIYGSPLREKLSSFCGFIVGVYSSNVSLIIKGMPQDKNIIYLPDGIYLENIAVDTSRVVIGNETIMCSPWYKSSPFKDYPTNLLVGDENGFYDKGELTRFLYQYFLDRYSSKNVNTNFSNEIVLYGLKNVIRPIEQGTSYERVQITIREVPLNKGEVNNYMFTLNGKYITSGSKYPTHNVLINNGEIMDLGCPDELDSFQNKFYAYVLANFQDD